MSSYPEYVWMAYQARSVVLTCLGIELNDQTEHICEDRVQCAQEQGQANGHRDYDAGVFDQLLARRPSHTAKLNAYFLEELSYGCHMKLIKIRPKAQG